MKKRKFSQKAVKKLKVFVLFLFLSICLKQAGTPELSLTPQCFLHVILILVWLFSGLYLLDFIGREKKTGERRQGGEEELY